MDYNYENASTTYNYGNSYDENPEPTQDAEMEPQADEREKESRRQQDEEDEEDEEDYDDEEDEEDEDGAVRQRHKRLKRGRRKDAISRFIDLEAEVSDEEEEDEEGDAEEGDVFIDPLDAVDEDNIRRQHALLDKQRFADDEKSPEQIAKALKGRYSGRSAVRYSGDMNDIPQRLLMPSVHDASLWQVRVKIGREREIVFSLMRKAIDLEFSANPLRILSAFQRDSLSGMIYVEAQSAAIVQQACNGLVGVYHARGVQLVPIDERATLLQLKKQEMSIVPGSWVRIRRGKYQGDLAQVVDAAENGEDIGLRLVPRIDLNPKDDSAADPSRKRKKSALGSIRPPQRLFNYEEVIKVYGRGAVSKRGHAFVFQSETFKDGFIEKDFKLSALISENVNPSLDEITHFSRRNENSEVDNSVDLSVIAEASRKSAIAVLQPGDYVEVFEGEQAGVHGVVEEIHQDIVTIAASGVDIEGQKVALPARSVRKRFKPGDHVKVMAGKNTDETGLVVSVSENIVTFISDMSMQEVSVFSKDLREAAEVGSSTNIVGNYELHDLVQLDLQTVGVIFKTERDSFRVLDQTGQIRLVQPHQISMRKTSDRAIATDADGHELRVNDNMKEIDGEGRKGRVLHIYQSFYAFLHNRDISENGGVFVTRTRSLVSQAPKGNAKPPVGDLSKMNPASMTPTGGMVGSGNMGRGPRDRDIGLTVVIINGPNKGYNGIIKDTNGTIARVELSTGNKNVPIDKSKLHRLFPDGHHEPLSKSRNIGQGGRGGAPRTTNPYATGANTSRTPAWGATKTPNPYMDGRTPAWNASSRTPNPYSNGMQTPAWNASSRTPNPYANGGQTPAWNANSKTPNPYAGGQTPRWNGSATPRHNTSGWGGDSWGASADTPWTPETPAYVGAPTPAAAQTPAAYWTPNFPTGSAQTPAASAAPIMDNEEDIETTLEPDWMYDPRFAQHMTKFKIKIFGTQVDHYIDGKYEHRVGQIMAGTKAAEEFDQTALVKFDDDEQRSILAKYIVPVEPQSKDDRAVILQGKHIGREVQVREPPDSQLVTVSFVDSGNWEEIPKARLAMLWP